MRLLEPFGTLVVAEGLLSMRLGQEETGMTSTRFVMRLMIGSIGDRTIPRAFRVEGRLAETADVRDQVTLRRSWLTRVCSWAASHIVALYRAADAVVRAFGPPFDESELSPRTNVSKMNPESADEHRGDRVFLRPQPLANPVIARWRFLERTAEVDGGEPSEIKRP